VESRFNGDLNMGYNIDTNIELFQILSLPLF